MECLRFNWINALFGDIERAWARRRRTQFIPTRSRLEGFSFSEAKEEAAPESPAPLTYLIITL
jgi:hypothetical protein